MRLVKQEEHSYTLPKEGIQYENSFTLSSGQLTNTGVTTMAPPSDKGHFILFLLEKPDSNYRAQIPFQKNSAASWNTLLSYHLFSMPWAKILTSKTVIPLYESSPTKQAKHLMCWLYVQTSYGNVPQVTLLSHQRLNLTVIRYQQLGPLHHPQIRQCESGLH